MSTGAFLARFSPRCGTAQGARELQAALDQAGGAFAASSPGAEFAWTGEGGSAPGTTATLCLLAGRVRGLEALANELGVEPESPATTLLALGHERLGEGLLERLRGSFALLLWGRESGRGYAACDQLGGRELLFCEHNGELAIGSELSDVLATLGRRPDVDETSLSHWLARRPLPGSRTLYSGVSRLGPGRMLRLGADPARERRWWGPRFREPLAVRHHDAVEGVRIQMSAAVERALAGAVNPGAMLSGGLDSAGVVGLASRAEGPAPRAYAGVFPEHPEVDESQRIHLLRDELGLELREHAFAGGSAAAAAERFITGIGEPPSSPNWFVWRPLEELARGDGVDVMLDGEGGDELFGCSPYLLADLLRRGRIPQLLATARRIPGMGDDPRPRWVARAVARYGVRGLLPPTLHAAARRARNGGPRAPAWLTEEAGRRLEAAWDPDAWKRLDGPRWWAALADSLVDGPARLGAPRELRQAARLAGYEDAHPWRDLDLVEHMLGLPPDLSFDPHLDRPLARAAMLGILPDGVRLSQAKPTFNRLLEDALSGVDRALVDAILAEPPEPIASLVRPDRLRELLGARSGPFALEAWRIVTAALWLRSPSS